VDVLRTGLILTWLGPLGPCSRAYAYDWQKEVTRVSSVQEHRRWRDSRMTYQLALPWASSTRKRSVVEWRLW
jgi:hypothetical protein